MLVKIILHSLSSAAEYRLLEGNKYYVICHNKKQLTQKISNI